MGVQTFFAVYVARVLAKALNMRVWFDIGFYSEK